MKVSTNRIFVPWIVLFLMTVAASPTLGHEWTIQGKKVKAKVVDYNQSHVLLEDQNGQRKSFPLNELTAGDMQHLSNMAGLRNGQLQNSIANEQVKLQRAELLAQFVDAWTVNMITPNGQTGWRNYFAENSLIATQLARQEFPNARVTSVRRLRRNLPAQSGINPIIQVPRINVVPFGSVLPAGVFFRSNF